MSVRLSICVSLSLSFFFSFLCFAFLPFSLRFCSSVFSFSFAQWKNLLPQRFEIHFILVIVFLLLDSPSCSEFLFHRHCRATHLLRVIARFSENLVLRPFLFGEQSGTERWIRHTVRASALRAELLPLAPPPRVWFIAHLFTLFYSLIFNLFALSFYT